MHAFPWRALAVPALALAYVGAYHLLLPPLRPQSLVFPRLMAVAILVFALLITAVSVLRTRVAPPLAREGPGLRGPAILFGLCVAYVALFALAGFLVASVLFMLAAMTAFPVAWPWRIGVTAGTVGILYLIFSVLFGIQM